MTDTTKNVIKKEISDEFAKEEDCELTFDDVIVDSDSYGTIKVTIKGYSNMKYELSPDSDDDTFYSIHAREYVSNNPTGWYIYEEGTNTYPLAEIDAQIGRRIAETF